MLQGSIYRDIYHSVVQYYRRKFPTLLPHRHLGISNWCWYMLCFVLFVYICKYTSILLPSVYNVIVLYFWLYDLVYYFLHCRFMLYTCLIWVDFQGVLGRGHVAHVPNTYNLHTLSLSNWYGGFPATACGRFPHLCCQSMFVITCITVMTLCIGIILC